MEIQRAADATFGVLLRRHRLRAGLSQEQLAERAGLSVNGIGALERADRRYPYRGTVVLLAKALGLSAAEAAEFVAAAARPRPERSFAGAATAAADHVAPVTNLPGWHSTLIGRTAEIEELVRALSESRLVTVTGAGGIGKTRAALAVGDALVGIVDDGVWFVELAPVTVGSLVPSAVARALSIQHSPNRPLTESLLAYFKRRTLVLVLDNCEHVIADAAALADSLLNNCPQLRILATSREPLRIMGERSYRLASLPVPTVGECAGLDAAGAARYPAVELFVQRARAVDHRFALSDENASAIGEIGRRLDGIPLAIELAAARVNIMPVRALCAQLDRRFWILTGGDRNALARHQTMRATLDWSHGLLEKRDRAMFRRLGIFVNGFTIDAAQAVAIDDEFSERDVFDALASLVDKSLVMADPNDDSLRYRLLESTRTYAVEQLVAAGEHDTLASRHLRYFRDWFVKLRRDYDDQRPGIDASFATELDDVRVALDGALVRCELVDGAELLAATGCNPWRINALDREAITRYEAFLSRLPRARQGLLGKLGASLCNLFDGAGRDRESRAAAIAAIDHARMSGDGPILAAALGEYSRLLLWSHEFSAAENALAEAEAINGLSRLSRLRLLDCRASLSMETCDFDAAEKNFERLRKEWRLAGIGYHRNEAGATCQLAEIAFRRGQNQRAADLFRDAASLVHDDDTFLPWVLISLAPVFALSDSIEAAVVPAIDVIGLWGHRDPVHLCVALAIELLAYVAAAQGDLDRSARLAGYADAQFTRIGFTRDYIPLSVYERLTTRLQELAPSVCARLMSQGASMTPDAAIALARTLDTNPAP